MKSLKYTAILILSLALTSVAVAQRHSHNSVQASFHSYYHRQQIVIPNVCGYNVYTAGLHTHTIYSDGQVTPLYRVREAWRYGLDILAITDHIEYRPTENDMLRYMTGYIKDEYSDRPRGVNTNVSRREADERGIIADLNVGYETAKTANEKFGLLLIRGAEITRGDNHFNVLFTKDNNKVYDADIEKSMRNAIDQGAIVIHNHPKIDKSTETQMTPLAESLHAKGLLSGVEVGNSFHSWDHLFRYAIDKGYALISGTDAHSSFDEFYYQNGNRSTYPNMTLVLAKRCDEQSIKEALVKGRTIAYQNGKLIGREEYLLGLFNASVSLQHMCDTRRETMVIITNKSSFPYELRYNKHNAVVHAMGSLQISLPIGAKEVEFEVRNLFVGKGEYVKVKMAVQR